jgi:hypothetical protein
MRRGPKRTGGGTLPSRVSSARSSACSATDVEPRQQRRARVHEVRLVLRADGPRAPEARGCDESRVAARSASAASASRTRAGGSSRLLPSATYAGIQRTPGPRSTRRAAALRRDRRRRRRRGAPPLTPVLAASGSRCAPVPPRAAAVPRRAVPGSPSTSPRVPAAPSPARARSTRKSYALRKRGCCRSASARRPSRRSKRGCSAMSSRSGSVKRFGTATRRTVCSAIVSAASSSACDSVAPVSARRASAIR